MITKVIGDVRPGVVRSTKSHRSQRTPLDHRGDLDPHAGWRGGLLLGCALDVTGDLHMRRAEGQVVLASLRRGGKTVKRYALPAADQYASFRLRA